jgi:hypothetical protein
MYGYDHKRTEGQFEITWSELQHGLPTTGDTGFLLGVSDNKLLLDGIPLETGNAERSFATLLSTAGLASLHFSKEVTIEDFTRLVRAFTVAGSKSQDVSKQIKEALGAGKQGSTIKINEVKFVAADPLTGDVSIAAQIAAQTLGPEFRQWLNDPQKLLQLIAAAEGANSGGGTAVDGVPMVPLGSVPNFGPGGGTGGGSGTGTGGHGGFGGAGTGTGSGGTGGGAGAATGVAPAWTGGMVPLQEQEVIQAIRLLTRFGQVQHDPGVKEEDLKQELTQTDPNTRLNLQQLLGSLAARATESQDDTPLLMKAAEHMAIRFALERYQKGEVKVNAVHQMMEHMSRQMDSLRQILKMQEEKMNKAGILLESHADILDRMFWAEVPESGKKSVLMSHEAPCVPPRNVRQFVEALLERGDNDAAAQILNNYSSCLATKDAEPRRRTAIGLSQLADLYARLGGEPMAQAIRKLSEQLIREKDAELQSLMSAGFVRLSQEASSAKNYAAVNEVCAGMELVSVERPVLMSDLRPRVGVENRLPEFIEEALRFDDAMPPDLLSILRRTCHAGAEHMSDRFFRCMQRNECDRMIELVKQLGSPMLVQLREILRTGQPRQAASAVGLVSRLDVETLLELLPVRLPEWNRFYHDMVVRQIAYGAAPDRGRTLLELAEVLDPLVLPEAVDEIGMSGDVSAAPPLIAMARPGDAASRSPFVQLKAIESLGRLKDLEAVATLREILESRKTFGYLHHKELRIAAAQALSKTDPKYSSQVMQDSGLEAAELAIAPLDSAPACPWVRQRRYERLVLAKTVTATIGSSWGKSRIMIRELSLGGGMGTKEDNLRIGSEADLEISLGMRSKIRAHVLLRRARVNEVGFEIVNTDLESRYRLRRLLVEALNSGPSTKPTEWGGVRKV